MQLVSRRRAIAVAAVAAFALLTGGCVSNESSRAQIDLIASYTKDKNPEWPYLDAVDQTGALCGPAVGCVQAVSNQYLALLKFGSAADAARYASAWGAEAHQVDPLVIRFNGTPLNPDDRLQVIRSVESINSDSPDH